MGLVEALVERVERLEAAEAIRNLHVTYALLVDEKRLDDVAELFTVDAIGDWGPDRGRVEGRDSIHRFFVETLAATSEMSRHVMTQQRIEVSGSEGTSECYLVGSGTKRTSSGLVPVWTLGRYLNELRLGDDGIWRFSHLKFRFTYQTPFDEGWVKNRMFRG